MKARFWPGFFHDGVTVKKLLFVLLMAVSVVALADVVLLFPNDRSLVPYYQWIARIQPELNRFDALMRRDGGGAYERMVFRQCGQENAFYSKGRREITMCLEMARMLMVLADRTKAPVERAGEMAAMSLIFILMHEFGHAVISGTSVPVLGREEDAADQIAATLARKSGVGPKMAAAVSLTWLRNAQFEEVFPGIRKLADEHGLTLQRRANIICWAGSDSREFMIGAIQRKMITPERANRCAAESAQAEKAVEAMIAGAQARTVSRNPWE
jgi:hypothetical protein